MLEFCHFSGKGGGSSLQKSLGIFLLGLGNFSERGGGVPDSKEDEELFFCIVLDTLKGKCGRITKSKHFEEL